MILLTLEGLPRGCVDLLKSVQQLTKSFIIPSPLAPMATACHVDEITTTLSNVLKNMQVLQRTQALSEASVLCGAHWVDSPTILDARSKRVLHGVCLELAAELAAELQLKIAKHVVVFVKIPVHEMFEMMLENMEARDVLINDLETSEAFLESVQKGALPPSVFPHDIHEVPYPVRMSDNNVDMAITAAKVMSILKSYL